MARRAAHQDDNVIPMRRKRATTPEVREQQLIASAVDLAEKQIHEGTASAQVITHYLKLGSSRERLEQERMSREIELMEVKAEAMRAAERTEELFAEAIRAMRSYQGEPEPENDDGVIDVYHD